MSEESQPLDGSTLRRYVEEVADVLPDDGRQRRLVVVGGALLAWNDLRDATRDIDSVEVIDGPLQTAIEVVAARHDLAPHWINDAAARFVPAEFAVTDTQTILDHPRLLVLGASLDLVLLMKIFAGRAADADDIHRLWPLTSFQTTGDAVDAFHDAYPHEARDPHLGRWLDRIVAS